MSRRARAAGFAAAAAVCAGLAAGASGAGDVGSQLGPLRDVLVATEPLPADRPIVPRTAARALELRRIPARFLPPGVLATPAQAIGRSPVVPIAAGAYLLASELRARRSADDRAEHELGSERHPVEIAVTGAGALAESANVPGSRVDVVVTTEAGATAGAGRTYVAAAGVVLLDLRPAGDSSAGDVLAGPVGDDWVATLGLTRGEALRLIHAQSFARDVRLISR